jgi:pyrroline-5-carboxylate reductase
MRIGFIGTGKIASAVVEAICTGGLKDYKIFVSPRNEKRSVDLESRFSQVRRMGSNQEVVDNSDIVFVALKPDIYEEVLASLDFRAQQNLVSLIPFSTLKRLKQLVNPAINISRATPLPTVVNHFCPIQVYRPCKPVLKILESIGQVLVIDTEEELHTIWTLTCLISPYYDLMSELSLWAKKNKVAVETADRYIAGMFSSLSHAAAKSEFPDFGLLSSHAATPGGLNEWTAESIESSGAHKSYTLAADYILDKFKKMAT